MQSKHVKSSDTDNFFFLPWWTFSNFSLRLTFNKIENGGKSNMGIIDVFQLCY